MPYAPAVTDQTAQFRAQGMQNAFGSISNAITDVAKTYAQSKQASDAADNFINSTYKTNPDLFKNADPKTQKELEKYINGEAGMSSKIKLAGWISTTQQVQQDKQAQQARDFQMADMARKQAAQQRLQQIGQLDAGIGGGVLNPQSQAGYGMQAGRAAPMPSSGMQQMGADQAAVGRGVVSPEILQQAGMQTGQPSYGIGATPGAFQPQGQQQMGRPAMSPTTAYALEVYKNTGAPPSDAAMGSFIERMMTLNSKGAAGVKPYNIHGVDAKGNPLIITKDKLTNAVLGQGPTQRLYESAEEAATRAGAAEEATLMSRSNAKFLDDLDARADNASQTLGLIDTINQNYEKGATTGAGQEYYTMMQNLMARATGREEKIANQQELEQSMAFMTLQVGKQLMSGSGSVSNFEREMVQKATANPSLTREANMRIFAIAKRAAERDKMLQQKRIELVDAGKKPNEIAQEIRKFKAGMLKAADDQYRTDSDLDTLDKKY